MRPSGRGRTLARRGQRCVPALDHSWSLILYFDGPEVAEPQSAGRGFELLRISVVERRWRANFIVRGRQLRTGLGLGELIESYAGLCLSFQRLGALLLLGSVPRGALKSLGAFLSDSLGLCSKDDTLHLHYRTHKVLPQGGVAPPPFTPPPLLA